MLLTNRDETSGPRIGRVFRKSYSDALCAEGTPLTPMVELGPCCVTVKMMER